MQAARTVEGSSGGIGAALNPAELLARMESVPFSRWHIWPRVIIGSATFFDAFTALALASAMPVLVREWGLTQLEVGYLLTSSYLGQLIGALMFGWLGERYGRSRPAAFATLIMALGSLACAFTGNCWELLICRFINSTGVRGSMPFAATYVNELSRAHGRGRFFLLYELIFPLGFLAAGILGARLVPIYGWQALFVLGTVPGLIITLLVLRLPESPRWLIGQGRLAAADAVIRQIEASTDKRQPVAVTPIVGGQKKSRWSELFSPVYLNRTLIVWIIWATAYGVTNGLNNWMATLYTTEYHLPLQTALNAALLTNATQILVLFLCILIIDKVGRRAWFTACFVLGGLLLVPLGVFGASDVTTFMILAT